MIFIDVNIKHESAANVVNGQKFATIAKFYGWSKDYGGEGKTAEVYLTELFKDDCTALLVRRVEHALMSSQKIEAMKKEQERVLNSNVLTELFGVSKT
jgi:hypothetical protein